jgi:Domain of unknown function (DUF4397)/LysM domain
VSTGRFHTRSLAPLVLGLCVWLIWPAQSLAKALVRFIHAVPGVGTATVAVDTGSGDQTLGSIAFAQATAWRSVRSGRFHWILTGAGKTLAQGSATIGNGAYDIVVLEKDMKVVLGVYRAQGGTAGTSRVRVIHAAPELGSPELQIDGKTVVNSLGYTAVTPYLSIAPGLHSLGAMRRGDSTPLVSGAHMRAMTGDAYSAVVLGTRGQRVRVVTLVDRGAPLVRGSHRATTSGAEATMEGPTGLHPGGTYQIRSGDCLWAIARGVVGQGAGNEAVYREVSAIWHENAQRIGTGDPNLIYPGTTLHLPSTNV